MQTVKLDARWGDNQTLHNGGKYMAMCCLGVVEVDTGATKFDTEHKTWPVWTDDETDTMAAIHETNLGARQAWHESLHGYQADGNTEEWTKHLNTVLQEVYNNVEPLIHQMREEFEREPVDIEFVPVTEEQFVAAAKEHGYA